jgi:hypothetical protein
MLNSEGPETLTQNEKTRIKGSYKDEAVTSQFLNLRVLCNKKTKNEKEKKGRGKILQASYMRNIGLCMPD